MWCLWLIEADTPVGNTGAPSLLCRMADVAAAAASDMPSSARRIANRPPRNPSCSHRVSHRVKVSLSKHVVGHRLRLTSGQTNRLERHVVECYCCCCCCNGTLSCGKYIPWCHYVVTYISYVYTSFTSASYP